MNRIAILTALTLEQNSVVENHLRNLKIETHPSTGTKYYLGDCVVDGASVEAVVVRTNQTNVNAAIETERMINHDQPEIAFFVGVAGGLKDVGIGDIVIGSDVYGYERGKSTTEFLPRPKFGSSSYDLEMSAVDYSQTTKWRSRATELLETKFQKSINVFAGTIASGEKVVASLESELYKFLNQNASHALAVEMEGLGFLEVCRHHPLVKSLVIRGISDLVTGKSDADRQGSQEYASRNATAFLFGIVEHLRIETIPRLTERKAQLLEIAVKLYPEGLKDRAIWTRSGGDLSQVFLGQVGKAQWVDALRLVELGGGGDIDFATLTEAMKTDFPKSDLFR